MIKCSKNAKTVRLAKKGIQPTRDTELTDSLKVNGWKEQCDG